MTQRSERARLDPDTLKRQIEDLKRMQLELERLLAEVEPTAQPKVHRIQPNSVDLDRFDAHKESKEVSSRPIRAVVLDALQDLGCPAYSRELAQYCQARYGRRISLTRFGTLAADEEKAFSRPSRRPRTLWVCFTLTFDRHQPIKRLLARSDWPLSKRIFAPTTGRIQHLWMTRRLCELVLENRDRAADPQMFEIIAADHARDVLGVGFKRGDFRFAEWKELAESQLKELLPEDERLREESAQRLALRPERVKLFGMPDVIEGGRAWGASAKQSERGKA